MSEDQIPQEEAPLSYYVTKQDKYGRQVNIPVVDVRDGIGERMLAMAIIKASQSSKYIVYNQYHVSRKPVKNLSE
jgi:hypothetical protein